MAQKRLFHTYDYTALKSRYFELVNDALKRPYLKVLCCYRSPSSIRRSAISGLLRGWWSRGRAQGYQGFEALKIDIERHPMNHNPILTDVKRSSCRITNSATKSILKLVNSVSCDNIFDSIAVNIFLDYIFLYCFLALSLPTAPLFPSCN